MTAFKGRKTLGRRNARRGGFLARLRRDERGNTLAIMAAALIPMIGMVGSAVDISRAYLVKTRLQQACDAGVLAARRMMTGTSITSDTNAKTQATNFFNINLKTGAYGATVTSITVNDVNDANGHASGTISGTASATVPTTLMRIFNKPSLTMNVTCDAEMHISNQDVMFVLDVTGSMNCPAATPSCSNNGGVEASNSKINAVRGGVVEFYDTLNGAMTQGARLRIGIVPYSSNVNVGKLLPASYISDTWNYQSRVAKFDQQVYVPNYGAQTASGIDLPSVSMSQANCARYGQDQSATDANGSSVSGTGSGNPVIVSGGPPPANSVTKLYTNDSTAGVDWGWSGAADTSGTNQSCRRRWTQQPTTYTTRYGLNSTNWTYQQDQFDTSKFKLGNALAFADDSNLSGVTVGTSGSYNMQELAADATAQGVTTVTMPVWRGCLEERDTVSNATFPTIPSNAYDLQIDLLPTSIATSWHPWWPELIWDRAGGPTSTSTSTGGQPLNFNAAHDFTVCPKQATKLAVMTHQDVYNYVNASDFKAQGGTYHDVGMIWGARLLSPTGIFASENATAPNGEPINRNIIFMTDGDMAPNSQIYSLYGYEKVDRRISGASNTPTNTDLQDRHNSRFLAICDAIKNMDITIWVVAYDQSMTAQLQSCASGTGTDKKAYYAANDAQMKAALQSIASQIAELRLSR